MVADATTNSNSKPNHHHHNHHSSGEEKQHHKQLDREVRDMVSAITSRVSHLHKDGPSHGQHEGHEDDGHGVRIITLAGTNTGATLKSELDDEKAQNHQGHNPHGGGDHQDALRTYVNSNFQAINNSIMMGGSYTTNDPGVHMDIADVDDHGHKDKDKKKKKKKDKESDHHSGGSD